jgi:frataxin
MALDEKRFQTLAEDTLDQLLAAIEEACADRAEVEFEGGILTVAPTTGGQFVVNRHGPTRQIWLSSPQSGAWHFAWDEGAATWRSTRGLETLVEVLERDLGQALGQKVALG